MNLYDEKGRQVGYIENSGAFGCIIPETTTYKIIRIYSPDDGRITKTIRQGLTLEEAQEHCNDPTTRKEGVYFDGYTKE